MTAVVRVLFDTILASGKRCGQMFGRLLMSLCWSRVVCMAEEADVRSVRALAGPGLVEAYEEALLGMARREAGNPLMTLEEAEEWYQARRIASGHGPSRMSSTSAPAGRS